MKIRFKQILRKLKHVDTNKENFLGKILYMETNTISCTHIVNTSTLYENKLKNSLFFSSHINLDWKVVIAWKLPTIFVHAWKMHTTLTPSFDDQQWSNNAILKYTSVSRFNGVSSNPIWSYPFFKISVKMFKRVSGIKCIWLRKDLQK